MLIVLAYDLSPTAVRAAALIAHTPWPADTTVHIVTNPAGVEAEASSFAGLAQVRAHDRARRLVIGSAHADLAQEFTASGLSVESRIVRGRPGSSIVRAAAELGADLIIAGARRRGAVAATLLGSVSTEIVERADCSVLIARGSTFTRVLLATDGSPTATLATSVLADWPAFANARLRVVAVGAAPPSYVGSVLSPDEVQAEYDGSLAGSVAEADVIARAASQVLARTHAEVDAQVRTGDPGREIVAATQEWAADLVVLGSDRATTRRGLLLGSVARHVLQGIDSSALIVRSPA